MKVRCNSKGVVLHISFFCSRPFLDLWSPAICEFSVCVCVCVCACVFMSVCVCVCICECVYDSDICEKFDKYDCIPNVKMPISHLTRTHEFYPILICKIFFEGGCGNFSFLFLRLFRSILFY